MRRLFTLLTEASRLVEDFLGGSLAESAVGLLSVAHAAFEGVPLPAGGVQAFPECLDFAVLRLEFFSGKLLGFLFEGLPVLVDEFSIDLYFLGFFSQPSRLGPRVDFEVCQRLFAFFDVRLPLFDVFQAFASRARRV